MNKKFFRIAGIILYFLFGIAAIIKCNLFGALLVAGTWFASELYHISKEDEPEVEPEHDSCEGCKHNLGGGHCKINLEGECREGGGYEAWED